MQAFISNNVLKISVFEREDLVFKILNNKYNGNILKVINNISIVEELFLKIKLYEDNNILEIIT